MMQNKKYKKKRKAACLDEISSKVWKTRKFDYISLHFYDTVNKQNATEKWTKSCIFPFPQNGDIEITTNDITATSDKGYNALPINRN